MKEAVLGIDLGTSAVKIIAVNQSGHVITSTSVPLNLIQSQPGYSEQDRRNGLMQLKQAYIS